MTYTSSKHRNSWPNLTILYILDLDQWSFHCFHHYNVIVIITNSKSMIWMESSPTNLKGNIAFNHVVSSAGIFWWNEIFNLCKNICPTFACQLRLICISIKWMEVLLDECTGLVKKNTQISTTNLFGPNYQKLQAPNWSVSVKKAKMN